MTTNSTTGQHPFDLLEAFALDTLQPDEEQAVTGHLEECAQCYAIVEDNLRVAMALADTVPALAPSTQLRNRLLDSIDPPIGHASSVSVPVSHRQPPRSWSRVSFAVSRRWVRLLAPAGAALAVALIAVTLALNVQIAGNIDNMQSENARLQNRLDQSMATTTALTRSSTTISQMQGNLQRWQQTSYALAQPGNQTLIMDPAHTGVDSSGFIVLSEDTTEAILMVSGLLPPKLDSVYHVWLTRGGQRHWAGEMDVDGQGRGTMALVPPDPLASYDSVQLSKGMGAAAVLAAPAGSEARARATAGMVGDVMLVAQLN